MLIIVILTHILVEKCFAFCQCESEENGHVGNPENEENGQVENEESEENGHARNPENEENGQFENAESDENDQVESEEIHLVNLGTILYTFMFSLLLSVLLYFPSETIPIRIKLLFKDFSALILDPVPMIVFYCRNPHIWNFLGQKIRNFRQSSVQPQINIVEIEMVEMNHIS